MTGELDRLPLGGRRIRRDRVQRRVAFCADVSHFDGMLDELWRVLARDGMLFVRLASNVGLEHAIGAAGRRVRLPDGSDRFVVDEAMLLERTARMGAQLLDPLKTTNVQQQRCMTTWCVET